jgi:polyhydroxybutyrate depolymerase
MKKIGYLLFALLFIKNSTAQITSTFMFDGTSRTYITYTPSNYSATKSYPLVFVLHGLTQNGSGIMNYSNFNAIAETNQFIAVYPTGTGFPTSWNATIGATGTNDFGFMNALCDTIEKNYSIQKSKIFSCGFSNGGFLSHMLACQSTRFAAIAAVSGTMTEGTFTACNPSKSIPVLQIHGTTDAVVNYNGAAGINKSVDDVINFWVGKNSCPSTPTTTAMPNINTTDNSTVDSIEYAPCANGSRVQHLKITGGGHQWPNANGISGLGTINKDINTAQSIWNFFNAVAPLALENTRKINVAISPNPASTEIKVNLAEPCKLKVYSLQGQLLITENKSTTVTVAQLPKGVYYLQVMSENNDRLGGAIFEKL